MIAVVQRVSQCMVTVKDAPVGTIGQGLLVLLGVSVDDRDTDVDYLADKIPNLRIFEVNDGPVTLIVRSPGHGSGGHCD